MVRETGRGFELARLDSLVEEGRRTKDLAPYPYNGPSDARDEPTRIASLLSRKEQAGDDIDRRS
eukprot:2303574-Pleurochrysis_carterae.AAC.1